MLWSRGLNSVLIDYVILISILTLFFASNQTFNNYLFCLFYKTIPYFSIV